MKKEQKAPQNEEKTSVEEPQSAHATPVVEHYVEQRKDKAATQIEEEKED